jgi:hypothetical protein
VTKQQVSVEQKKFGARRDDNIVLQCKDNFPQTSNTSKKREYYAIQ